MEEKLIVTMGDLNTERYSNLLEAKDLLEVSGLKWEKLNTIIEEVKSLAQITNPNWMGWYDRDVLEDMYKRGKVEYDLNGEEPTIALDISEDGE